MNDPHRHRWLVPALLGIILVGSLAGTVVEMGIGWDFANFYDAGRKVVAGQVDDLYNPLVEIAGEPAQGTLGYFGFPLTAVLFAPLATMGPSAAIIVFKIAASICLFLALFLIYRYAVKYGLPDGDPARLLPGFLFAVLLFQPFWTIYRVGGQTTPAVLLLSILSLSMLLRGRAVLPAVLLVVAVFIKPVFAPGLVLLSLAVSRRFFVSVALTGIGLGLLSVLCFGWSIHDSFLQQVRAGSEASVWWVWNSALTVPLENLHLLTNPERFADTRPAWLAAAVLAVKITVIAFFVWATVRCRLRQLSAPARIHLAFHLAVCFSLLVSPIVWEHYLSLLFVTLAYLLASRDVLSPGVNRLVTAIIGFCVLQNLELVTRLNDLLAPEGPVGLVLVGFLKSAPLTLTLVLLAFHLRELRELHLRPVWNRS